VLKILQICLRLFDKGLTFMIGLDPIPESCFDCFILLLFQIHFSRIWNCFARVINHKTSEEGEGSTLETLSDFVLKLLIFILGSTSFFCHYLFRFPSSYLVGTCT
jgi:hypothetical protein